ncbi:lipid A hydroxylase LpxO [Frateuria defendens]|uniref:lipid A hydroxylase LpxO n=1 Tax=Frateuria defendens TaxID=2219559 RepID=UPI00066FCA7E|nr:lipid A hydroxylase LpxO [Frateuria defendens]
MVKWLIVALFLASVLYVHRRGRVRHKFGRQLLDHSTFMAPLNVLMYAFSRVPTTPFIAVPERHFPELEPLRARWREIREEALKLRAQQQIKAADGYNDAGFNSFFRRGWKRFYLKWYDEAHPSAAELCPVTTELLRAIPSVKAAMFAELPPGSDLRRHRDPYAGSLRLHLGLETPNDDGCFINVDGQHYSWRDGEWTMFDETYIHFAKNQTAHDRVILFCDVERPLKYRWAQRFNHFVARRLLAAGASPNREGDKTGGINRLFGRFYALRLRSKEFRKRNKRAYYALKYLAVLLVVLFVVWI